MMDEEKMDSTDIDQQMVMEAYVMGIPDMSAEESLEAFWEYVKEREREEKIIAGR